MLSSYYFKDCPGWGVNLVYFCFCFLPFNCRTLNNSATSLRPLSWALCFHIYLLFSGKLWNSCCRMLTALWLSARPPSRFWSSGAMKSGWLTGRWRISFAGTDICRIRTWSSTWLITRSGNSWSNARRLFCKSKQFYHFKEEFTSNEDAQTDEAEHRVCSLNKQPVTSCQIRADLCYINGLAFFCCSSLNDFGLHLNTYALPPLQV